jgi:hypothetical protein
MIQIWWYCDGIWSFGRQRLGKHCLKAGIIEAEVFFASQRLGKHLFPRQRMVTKAFPSQHKKKQRNCSTWWLLSRPRGSYKRQCIRVEAGSNTSTVTLRVVGGDEKGSLESETVIYGHEPYGTRTRKWLRWRGPAAIVNDRPVLSSERAPQINKPATVTQ